jgi:hypothetical protein
MENKKSNKSLAELSNDHNILVIPPAVDMTKALGGLKTNNNTERNNNNKWSSFCGGIVPQM